MMIAPHTYAPGSYVHWLETLIVASLVTLSALLVVKQRTARIAGYSGASAATSVFGPRNVADSPAGLEADQLCAFIRETTALDSHSKPGQKLVSLVQSVFQAESVAIYDADLHEVYRAGEWSSDVHDVLRNICTFGTQSDDLQTGLSKRVLHMGDLPIGAMLLRGETRGRMASTIASIVAIAFDRYHALANESRTESARQTELLRSSVLDSLAHAYKTPLTVIGAASEGLSAMGSLTTAQAGLVALIDEQTLLLSQLTTRLLKTARLQSHEITPHSEKVAVAPLIEDVVASLRDQLADLQVRIAVSSDDLSLCCDRNLLVALLTQYVDNAAKYGTAGSQVTIKADEHAAEVVFSVHSVGPAIPSSDFERIFDRYYRSSLQDNKVSGTGIGLSVARRTAQAQGGRVWVTSDAEQGTTFYASLPALQSTVLHAAQSARQQGTIRI